MPIIYENDEDKYYDKEDIKKYKKGSQSGIESSRGGGLFLPGIKSGSGLYLPSRKNYEGNGIVNEDDINGDGIIESIINAGKTVIEFLH